MLSRLVLLAGGGLDPLDELVPVVDVEDEDAGAAELQVVADAGRDDVEVPAVRQARRRRPKGVGPGAARQRKMESKHGVAPARVDPCMARLPVYLTRLPATACLSPMKQFLSLASSVASLSPVLRPGAGREGPRREDGPRHGDLQEARAAGAGQAVPEVPRRREDRRRVRHDRPRPAAQGRRSRAGRRLRRAEEEPALPDGRAREEAGHAVQGARSSRTRPFSQFAAWIDNGAPYDAPLVDRKDAAAWTDKKVTPEARQHWAFQPLKRVTPPDVKDATWVKTDVDRFILAKLEAEGHRAEPAGDEASADPPGVLRPDRPAADARRGRRVREGRLAGRVREGRRSSCSPRRTTASAGRGTGSTWPASPRATASSTTTTGRRPTTTATSSSRRSTRTCRTTSSSTWQLAGDEFAPNDPLALMATGFLAAGVHSTQITKNEVEKHRYDELDDMLAHDRHGVARPDGRLRPLPRPQVRRDPRRRLLPDAVGVHHDGPQRSRTSTSTRRAIERRRPAFDAEHAPLVEGAGRVRGEGVAGAGSRSGRRSRPASRSRRPG